MDAEPERTLAYQRFLARVEGIEEPIEVAEDGDRYWVRRGGEEFPVTWTALPGGRVLLRLAGRPLIARISRTAPEEYLLDARSRQLSLRVEDEISARTSRAHRTARGGAEEVLRITAPMPGTIVQVLVEEGETVSTGQALLIIEAMKMQNEVVSPAAGTVRHLTAEPGRAVDARQPLCEVVP
jgi:biotin carboxyl carrier protein